MNNLSGSQLSRYRNRTRMNIHSPGVVKNPAQIPLVFLVAHIPLGILMSESSEVATAHGFLVAIFGLCFVLFSPSALNLARVAAYTACCDVLWRMTRAEIYWESGKYLIVLFLAIGFLRFASDFRKATKPVYYFALLVPGIVMSLFALGWSEIARQEISFNLSGPLALMMSVMFFSQIQVSRVQLSRILWSSIAPICAIAVISLYGLATASGPVYTIYTMNSSFAASGGFGPNQVSNSLGLGAVLCMLVIVCAGRKKHLIPVLVLLVWFMIQAILTLSRGGVFAAILTMAIAGIHYLNNRRARNISLVIVTVIGAILIFLLTPYLDDYTEGAIARRFEQKTTTNRFEIGQADLDIWLNNPLLGVGPGMARNIRVSSGLFNVGAAAHTEFTRLLAEHGLLGLISLVMLFRIALNSYRKSQTVQEKAMVSALIVWPLILMSHSAMRVASIPFFFGLAMSTLAEFRTRTAMSKYLLHHSKSTRMKVHQ